MGKDIVFVDGDLTLNCTSTPEECNFADMSSIVSADAPEEIYISPVGCFWNSQEKKRKKPKDQSKA